MACVSELVGLRSVADEMQKLGGSLVAICTDPPDESAKVVKKASLSFSILSDEDAKTIRAFGLLHAGAGPGHTDIAVPAQVLVGKDGTILWRRRSVRVQDRPAPQEVIDAVHAALSPS